MQSVVRRKWNGKMSPGLEGIFFINSHFLPLHKPACQNPDQITQSSTYFSALKYIRGNKNKSYLLRQLRSVLEKSRAGNESDRPLAELWQTLASFPFLFLKM